MRQETAIHLRLGDTPGTYAATIDDDPTEKEAIVYYTDYENCVVTSVEFSDQFCALWTRRSVKDAVPQNCIDYFVDICDAPVPEHSRDLCVDGEGDY
ncbi:hypothetical protein MTO96_032669 [Rhipicephalus appendiculatus]